MAGSERVDAARNRAAILAAAEDLFSREDAAKVSMSDIAEAAGVGKGTVFRRFGDRTALIHAILAPRSNELRRKVEHGPPPLGPGGPPLESLYAYLDALLEFVWANRSLVHALEDRGARAYYDPPSSQYWINELARRLTAAHPGRTDSEYLAHILYTALRADVVDYLVSTRGMHLDCIRDNMRKLVTP